MACDKTITTRSMTNILAIIAFFGILYVIGVSTWQGIEEDPLVVTHINGQTEEDDVGDVRRNEVVIFQRKVCVSKPVNVNVTREIINVNNNNRHMLPTIQYSAAPGDTCYTANFYLTIPPQLNEGEYKYNPTLIYDVNPGLTITKRSPGILFEIQE